MAPIAASELLRREGGEWPRIDPDAPPRHARHAPAPPPIPEQAVLEHEPGKPGERTEFWFGSPPELARGYVRPTSHK